MVAKTFGLTFQPENNTLLAEWMTVQDTISQNEKAALEELRQNLRLHVNAWNEETLKMKFIAFLLGMVKYDTPDIQSIFDAELSAKVEGRSIKVITDFLLAKASFDVVEAPYFYFHQYKRKKKNADDPVAQVLLAMLVAKEKNQNNKPLYGCYVIGEFWFFMVMSEKTYSIAYALDATKSQDLHSIFLILQKFKIILHTQLI